MGASLGIMYNNLNYALSINSDAMLRLQEQAATGQRINRASDDPLNALRIMELTGEVNSLQGLQSSCADVSDVLNFSSTMIQNVQDNINKARELATQIISDTYSDDSGQRAVAGQAIDEILEQVLTLANTQRLNQYIFGGNNSSSPPFKAERDTNGKIISVTYEGSDNVRRAEVAPGIQADVALVGNDIFSSDTRSEPVFYGDTGAKAGTGTSTVRGDVWLTVASDSAGYKISIDDGASYTTVPAGGQENTAVTDSRTGDILYVDTRSLTDTGVTAVRVPGTYDVFGALITARDSLQNNRNLSEEDLRNLRNTMISSLEEVNVELARQLTKVGTQISSLDTLKTTMQDSQTQAQQQADSIGQADIAQVAIDLSRRQTLYEMSINVAGRLFSLSLLDFIK
jgi:flagellar hook-associated protein 3 FlgL